MNWEEALQQLEDAPPLDEKERGALCVTVREEIIRLHSAASPPAHAIKKIVADANAPVRDRTKVREALCWARGSSFSIRPLIGEMVWWDGVHSEVRARWEAKEEKPPMNLRLSTLEADDDVEKSLVALAGGMSVRMKIGIDEGSSPHPERDILIQDVVSRAIGGEDGRQALVVFGFRGGMRRDIPEEEPTE